MCPTESGRTLTLRKSGAWLEKACSNGTVEASSGAAGFVRGTISPSVQSAALSARTLRARSLSFTLGAVQLSPQGGVSKPCASPRPPWAMSRPSTHRMPRRHLSAPHSRRRCAPPPPPRRPPRQGQGKGQSRARGALARGPCPPCLLLRLISWIYIRNCVRRSHFRNPVGRKGQNPGLSEDVLVSPVPTKERPRSPPRFSWMGCGVSARISRGPWDRGRRGMRAPCQQDRRSRTASGAPRAGLIICLPPPYPPPRTHAVAHAPAHTV